MFLWVFNQHVFVYINSLFSLSLSTKQHKNYFAYFSKIFEFWVVQKNTQKLVNAKTFNFKIQKIFIL